MAISGAAELWRGSCPQGANEQDRLAALAEYDILDTAPEEIFDRITRLACRLFHVEMSMIAFVDGHRQWFKSRQGWGCGEGMREVSFCNQAVQDRQPLIVPDALADPRFCDNPLVTGDPKIRFYAGVPLNSHSGHAIGTFCIIDRQPSYMDAERFDTLRDLASMTSAALELRRQATVDALTGARARRAFSEEFARALALAERHQHAMSLLSFDIDHFKRVNDTYGHHAGDAVLAKTLEACRGALRDSDIVGRMGGEEFAVALPHTDAGAAMDVAEKLRSAIESADMIVDGAPIKITASFGVVAITGWPDDIGQVLGVADKALYSAKRSGRNRCVAAEYRREAGLGTTRRVLKAGSIVVRGRPHSECTIRRLSEVGAEVQVSENALVTDSFTLRIESEGFSRPCRVVGRDGPKIFVEFG